VAVSAKKPNPARATEATFRVRGGIYLLGSLERGVTVFNQQVRAHNLVWALWELDRKRPKRIHRIAVIGGGIAGLTATACILSLFNEVAVHLFEQRWDLCPLQQGADVRWLHPKIYDWPDPESRSPSASLPALNWTEGRASDVVRTIVREFSRYCASFAEPAKRLTVVLGLRHFQINARTREVSWVGSKGIRDGAFFISKGPHVGSMTFDIIVLATGFGLETFVQNYPTPSYWRNEQLGQAILDGQQRPYLVSGYGDGALIDLCRLTVERFRQDKIVEELFKQDLEQVEETLSREKTTLGPDANMFALFKSLEGGLLAPAKAELKRRIRKDTRVTLHVRGKDGEIKALSQIFGRNSSFLNRLITYLLYTCGAFAPDFSELAVAIKRHNVPPENVLCRYGANTIDHIKELFVEPTILAARLQKMKDAQAQKALHLWPPGLFRRPQTALE
jgi:hypothetical protein